MGVGKGLLVSFVPMVMVGIAVGFMRRVVKIGSKVGGN